MTAPDAHSPSPPRGEGGGEGAVESAPSHVVHAAKPPHSGRRPPHPHPLPGGEREKTVARVVTHGRAEIGFALRDGVSRLKHLFHHEPLRVLFPLPPPGDVPLAALVTTSGGVVG